MQFVMNSQKMQTISQCLKHGKMTLLLISRIS